MKKIIIMVLLIAIVIAGCSGHCQKITEYEYYTVSQGDTLWNIVTENYDNEKYDKRDIINLIVKVNDMENKELKANTTIKIPVIKK